MHKEKIPQNVETVMQVAAVMATRPQSFADRMFRVAITGHVHDDDRHIISEAMLIIERLRKIAGSICPECDNDLACAHCGQEIPDDIEVFAEEAPGGHLGNCDAETKDDGYSSCTCGYAKLRYDRLHTAEKLMAEIAKRRNTLVITDVEAAYIAGLLRREI